MAPVDPALLAKKGAFLTRPSLGHYTATREELTWRAGELFGLLAEKKLTLRIDSEFPLADAGSAHERLESRESAGKMLLIA